MIRQKTKFFVFWNDAEVETLLSKFSIHDNFDIPLSDSDVTTDYFCTVDVDHIIKIWKER